MTLEKINLDKKLLEYSLSQFRNIPEYIAICQAIAKGLGTIQDGVDYLSDMIDIDNAEGVWLDYIGWLIGIYRPYYAEINNEDYFCVNANDVNVDKMFWFSNSSAIQDESSKIGVDDNIFQNQIKSKIIYNVCGGTKEDIIKMFKSYSNADICKIYQIAPMVLNVDLIPISNDILYDNESLKNTFEHFLPNGVGINNLQIKTIQIEERKKLTVSGIDNLSFDNIVQGNDTIIIQSGRSGYRSVSVDNGETWTTPVSVDLVYSDVVYGDNKFVATMYEENNKGFITSEDGINWSDLIPSYYRFVNIIHDGKRFVALGIKTTADAGIIGVSENGEDWEYYMFTKFDIMSSYYNISKIIYNDKLNEYMIFIYQSHKVIITKDFVNFDYYEVDGNDYRFRIQNIIYGNGTYVLLANDFRQNSSNPKRVQKYSYDGRTWYDGNLTKQHAWQANQGLFYCNNLFIYVNNWDGLVYCYSLDGIKWSPTQRYTDQMSMTDLIYNENNNKFIGTGQTDTSDIYENSGNVLILDFLDKGANNDSETE